MSTQPPIIPISSDSSSSVASAAAGGSSPPPQVTAIRQLITRVADSTRQSLSNRRPWAELFDRSAFSKPESLSEAYSRIRKNLAYFRINYFAAIAAILAISLLTNPFSLLVLISLLAAWAFLYLLRPSDPPLVLFGRQFSDRETLGGLVLLSIFVVFLTSVGSILMSALTVGAAVVGAHGAFRMPEDLFLDDQEPGGAATGFLSFLGGAASNAAAAAGPAVVAARV